jgi:WD40 repeat protein
MKRLWLIGFMVLAGLLVMAPVQAQDDVEKLRTAIVNGNGINGVLSPDGRIAAAYTFAVLVDQDLPFEATLTDIALYSTPDLESLGTLSGASDFVGAAVFSPDSTQLITLHLNGDLIIWDIVSQSIVSERFIGLMGIQSASLLADGRTLVLNVGSQIGQIIFYDLESDVITHILTTRFERFAELQKSFGADMFLRGQLGIVAFAASEDGSRLFTANQNDQIDVWDVASSTVIQTLRPANPDLPMRLNIRQLVLSADEGTLYYQFHEERLLSAIDLSTGEEQVIAEGVQGGIAYLPGSDLFAWMGLPDEVAQTVSLYTKAGDSEASLHSTFPASLNYRVPVSQLYLTPDGQQVIFSGITINAIGDGIAVLDL